VLLPTSTRNPTTSGDGAFYYIDIESVDNQSQRIAVARKLANRDAPSRARNTVQGGDVVFSLVRPYLKNIAIVPESLNPAVASTAFFVCRPSQGVNSRFLLNYLRQTSFIASITTYGSSPPAARDDEFAKRPILLAPPNEQARIADALDELLSDLEAAVAGLERIRAKLKLYRASVLKAAVEGALTAEWRTQHPNVEPASELLDRILAERRCLWTNRQVAKFKGKGHEPVKNWKAKYKEPASPDTQDSTQLPDGWCWTLLDAVIVEGPQNGLYLPSTRYGGGISILRIDDFQNGRARSREDLNRVQADRDEAASYALRRRDLVINRVNSMTHLGKCFIVGEQLEAALFESNMMRAGLATLVDAKYVELYLHSEFGRRRLTRKAKWAVNQASINQEDVKSTPLPLPPLPEQEAIVELVEDQMSVIDHLEADIDANLNGAQSLRQAILRHAFSGKLVPQDPNDEPASELLKRIAAEREARSRGTKAVKSPGKRRRPRTKIN
jgi:type I restriction enzyme S subunit